MIDSRNRRRVVVTGVGVIAPCGTGPHDFWAGLGKTVPPSVIRPVSDFSAVDWGLSKVEIRRMDRFTQFGIAAAGQALHDGGLIPEPAAPGALPGLDSAQFGVFLGSGIGGALSWETQAYALRDRGPRAVSPLTVPMVMSNAAAAAVSIRWALRGACETISTACATGTQAIGAAARYIAVGRADAALAGATEACLTETNRASFGNMRALSSSGVSRPFDVERDGFCSGEGAGVLLLEEAGHAAARGARVYAEIAGVGSNADAHHLTAPAPGGEVAVACMRLALDDAGVAPYEVSHVNAHGTSTVLNDANEALAIATLFPHRPAVTSIKGATGHALSAAGAIEAVALALSFANRAVPPTIGTRSVDPTFDIDVVLSQRPWTPAPAVSNSFGFGGHNGTLVFVPA